MKYDVEGFITDLVTLFKSKLNDKAAALNTEKSDTLLTNINESAWYFHNLPTTWSYPVFVVYGLQNIEVINSQYNAQLQRITVFIEVAITDGGSSESEAQIYKLLRYTRCLQEIANENFDKLRGYSKLTVDSLPPTLVDVSGKILKTSGINVSASFDI